MSDSESLNNLAVLDGQARRLRGRPARTLSREVAERVLDLLGQGCPHQRVADAIVPPVSRTWITRHYRDGRLRQMAEERPLGEVPGAS